MGLATGFSQAGGIGESVVVHYVVGRYLEKLTEKI